MPATAMYASPMGKVRFYLGLAVLMVGIAVVKVAAKVMGGQFHAQHIEYEVHHFGSEYDPEMN